MSSSVVDWTEPSLADASGVDHLGMRVAGESAYRRLFDFTTTVTWHPRYYSYLCWSLERAFTEAGGRWGADQQRIDREAWRRAVKRRDYAMAVASRLADPDSWAIAGSTKVDHAIEDAGATVPIRADHLQASAGSLGIYGGPMAGLGLLDSAHEVDRPSEAGRRLAAAFDRVARAANAESVLCDLAVAAEPMAARQDLQRIGERCGLGGLARSALRWPDVAGERDALRQVIIDRERWRRGDERVGLRMRSIGLLLELFRAFEGRDVDLETFRAATLLDGIRTSKGVTWLRLPPHFDDVRARWRIYQAHAYANHALEVLLGLVLRTGRTLAIEHGDATPRDQVVAQIVEPLSRMPRGTAVLGKIWDAPLAAVVRRIETLVKARASAPVSEPDLCAAMVDAYRDADQDGLVAGAAGLLLLFAIVHMRVLESENAWGGEREAWRLPPARLVAHLSDAAHSGLSVRRYLANCVDQLVIRQHVTNALRKLAAQPGLDTALLRVQGPLMTVLPTKTFRPGTSEPRFDNVVSYLVDLGYLSEDDPARLTKEGRELLDELRRGPTAA